MTEYSYKDWVSIRDTPQDLFPTQIEGAGAVTLDPPALFMFVGGQWVPLASVEGNIPEPTLILATETVAGVVELATEAEVQSGASGTRVATVSRLRAELERRRAWWRRVLSGRG